MLGMTRDAAILHVSMFNAKKTPKLMARRLHDVTMKQQSMLLKIIINFQNFTNICMWVSSMTAKLSCLVRYSPCALCI